MKRLSFISWTRNVNGMYVQCPWAPYLICLFSGDEIFWYIGCRIRPLEPALRNEQSFADCSAVYNLSESCVCGMLCLYAYKKGEWKVMKFSEACESLLQTFIESLLSPLHYGRLRVSTESAYKIENCSDSVVLYPAVQDFFFSQSKSNSGHWVITTNI